MKADQIIKNAKIFTSNKDSLLASALVVKDGKFVYVGDEAGLSDYEGEVTDLEGKFIMPGIIDSHSHAPICVCFEYVDLGVWITCEGKQEALDFMAEHIRNNPGLERYRFLMERAILKGEELTKEDLDAICPDSELMVLEGEAHSIWLNSKILALHGITDDTPDPVPGLSCYVRKDGHITGNAYEYVIWPFIFDHLAKTLTDEQIEKAIDSWIDYCKRSGEIGFFDAGFPENDELHERIYAYLRDMDRQGRLPVYIDGCYMLTNRNKLKEALEETKRFNREFNTEHLKVHTLKIYMDGSLKLKTAGLVTPYEGTDDIGPTAFNGEEVAEILKELNEAGLDLHVHTVGERASRVVLDGVELARKELGDNYHVKVTCSHLEIQDKADLPRFAELGVFANYTPLWHTGYTEDDLSVLLGEERADNMYLSKSVWDTGAIVTWSSDDVVFYNDFEVWNPYLGMEVGMTRWSNEKTKSPDFCRTKVPCPPVSEQMSVEEMILGYTINGALQLGIEASKGSIEAGKDADFLVFDKDLLTAEHEGFSYNMPQNVYFCGKKVK